MMEAAMEAGDDPAFVAEGTITCIRLAVASNEEIVKAQPMMEEFPVAHPGQLTRNPALGLPLQLGHCDSCGATDLAKCEDRCALPKRAAKSDRPPRKRKKQKILQRHVSSSCSSNIPCQLTRHCQSCPANMSYGGDHPQLQLSLGQGLPPPSYCDERSLNT
ncbi:hypothetical protein ZWY2020_026977 [Hordeum vulgare]|nr:hypothetical protein ZWY2020_026977 [Hordeum vulgare]